MEYHWLNDMKTLTNLEIHQIHEEKDGHEEKQKEETVGLIDICFYIWYI